MDFNISVVSIPIAFQSPTLAKALCWSLTFESSLQTPRLAGFSAFDTEVDGVEPLDAGVGTSWTVIFGQNVCIDQETAHPRSTVRGCSLDRVRSRLDPAKGELRRRSERLSNWL